MNGLHLRILLLIVVVTCGCVLLVSADSLIFAQGIPLSTPVGEDAPPLAIEIEESPVVDQFGQIVSRESDLPASTETRQTSEMVLGAPHTGELVAKVNPGDITQDTVKLVPSDLGIEEVPLQLDDKGLQPPQQDGFVLPNPESEANPPSSDILVSPSFGVEPEAMSGWSTIKYEGFEGVFPNGAWRVFDNDGATNGEVYWDDDDYLPYAGRWSAWAANGGAQALDPQYYFYRNNMRSWMVYGPFDLSNSADAELLFRFWNQSEQNFDWFGWYASANGTNFYGYRTSGNSGGWRYVNFDLTNVYTLGNLVGDSSVWIAFVFNSDFSIVDDGPFVDEVVLQKNVSCPGQYLAQYYNNRGLSGNPTFTQCEGWPINQNWGSGGPGNGVGNDDFSVRWTGNAYIEAGTYEFKAVADDGINVWIDGQHIIKGWKDQPPTPYVTIVRLLSGIHSIRVEYYERGGGATAQFRWYSAPNPVQFFERDGFYVFKIDSWNPYVSFETVMAMDATSGNSTNREYVASMVGRSPYNARNPVLVINADYFGDNTDGTPHHGAEGLIVKNGTRFPNAGTQNGTEWRRSSLSISRWSSTSSTSMPTRTIRLGPQSDCSGPPDNQCSNWIPNSDAYHTTIGGGPLFVVDGTRVGGSNSNQPCINERRPNQTGDMPNRYCDSSKPTQWTAAGVTRNGRYLIIVVSKPGNAKTMDHAAAALIGVGAYRAIKLDGGGSTQVWYRPSGSLVSGGRPIANALMVFVQP